MQIIGVKRMRFWDFDGVIFDSCVDGKPQYNDQFFIDHWDDDARLADLPDTTNDILVTGRNNLQKDWVLAILAKKNIHFKTIIFSPFGAPDYADPNFFPRYYAWKRGIFENEKETDDDLAIDDDQKVLDVANALNLRTLHISDWRADLNWIPQ
jgi:hypothetical protein